MLKKNKGVTLVLLVIIIIVMLILLGVTITTSTDLIKDSRLKKYVTNMQLVQARAASIYENYMFYEGEEYEDSDEIESDILIGYKIKKSNKTIVTRCEQEYNVKDLWYRWDSDILLDQGIQTDLLKDGSYFLVNYVTGNVVYSKGFTTDEGRVVYSLEEMKEL